MNYGLIAYLIIFAGICLFWVFVLGKHGVTKRISKFCYLCGETNHHWKEIQGTGNIHSIHDCHKEGRHG